jgi:hypothetical protein
MATSDTLNAAGATDPHAIENLTPRQRVFAIVGASSGNLVEWFDFYIYSFCALYFSSAFFPKDNPTTQLLEHGRHLCRRLPDAPCRRLDVRPHRRPLRPPQRDDDLGADDVWRLAADRGAADLRHDRHRRPRAAAGGAFVPGPVGGRRIRHQRYLHERGGRAGAQGLLCFVPVRDPDRRPAGGAAGTGRPAAVPVA